MLSAQHESPSDILDNPTAVAYINHMDGSHDFYKNKFAKWIWQFGIDCNI